MDKPELIKYSFWNFGSADFSHGLNGLVGQVTHCRFGNITFWTRENANGVPTFLVSAPERWGDKAGATPRKERQSLELYVPHLDSWDEIFEMVKANDSINRRIMQNREFNQAWIDKFSKDAIWTWSKQAWRQEKSKTRV